MAESSGAQLTVEWFGLRTDVVYMSDWTNGQDSHQHEGGSLLISNSSESDHQKRSDIVHAIIDNWSLDHLGSILGSGWDVNETLWIPEHYMSHEKEIDGPGFEVLGHDYTLRTALREAVRRGWTEGVRMLLDAGAKCKTPGASSNILILALENTYCEPDLIDLLLKHGGDPKDHDDQCDNIPLLLTIYNVQEIKIFELLLEHGADPNVIGERERGKDCPLSAALDVRCDGSTPLLKTLVHFGVDVNYDVAGIVPLLHGMITYHSFPTCRHLFGHQEQLDLFFLHGGNINMEDGEHRTALEFAVRRNGHGNSIRWLIRHGADISTMKLTLLKEYFNFRETLGLRYFNSQRYYFSKTPLILLQVGMRVSHGVQTQLSKMLAWLQDDPQGEDNIYGRIRAMWDQLVEVEERELQRMQGNVRKPTFPDYWTHQMDALQEFSDESLQIYPQETQKYQDRWQDISDMFHTILEFLSQPQSLQWYCCQCVRENLVSLQPSVVKTLPVPARLKRYILCHEI